ncbi:uncharacterized protein LOC143295372 [Babylonia areolata]|uniref:uncharacterized protein LOC143295372 n=1 Tax=Babylonia areolata TaxID=304850 RepID=UPI003FD52606
MLDPAKQVTTKFASLEYFLRRFPRLKPPEVSVTDIQLEFAKYQCMDIRQCIEETERVDATWGEMSKLQEDSKPIFKLLPMIMMSILTIPHSSAHCEQVFSVVRKNQTDFRGKMGHETLQDLVVSKSRPGSAVERNYSKSELAELKSAYYKSLQSSRS